MTYHTTITRKGQIVIPKKIREQLHIQINQKLFLDMDEKKGEITIRPAKDILELAGKFKPKRRVNPKGEREALEKHYERI